MENEVKNIMNENDYFTARLRDIIAERSSANISHKIARKSREFVTIVNWFPVYHSGYYAIIGYNKTSNDFIMSEPIVSVFENSQRILESPRRYYEIVGDYSLMTFTQYECIYDINDMKHFEDFMKNNFKRGFPKNWVKCISKINDLERMCGLISVGHKHKTVNSTFEEISVPMSNCFYSYIFCYKALAICLKEVFVMIKNKEDWRSDLIKKLRSNGYQNLAQKLKLEKTKKMRLPEKGRSSKDYVSLFLWLPSKDIKKSTYSISGYVLDDYGNLQDFCSQIIYVHRSRVHVVTKKAAVRLVGPICRTTYEILPNSYIINVIGQKYLESFFYGLPPSWQDYLTVIDIVVGLEAVEWSPSDLVDDSTENKENATQARCTRRRQHLQ